MSLADIAQWRPGPIDRPQATPPSGTTDCHAHIFGPAIEYPYALERRFTPHDASCDDYRSVCNTLGIGRAVLVQPSVYGFDNRRLIDASVKLQMPTRLVVMVPPDVSETELDELDGKGARGVRVIGTLPIGAPLSSLAQLAEKLHDRNWHIQLLLNPELLVGMEQILREIPCRFVIDHMAHISADLGVDQPAFQALLRLLETGRFWVKLSAPYHLSNLGPVYPDVIPFAHLLVHSHIERLVWGSDWPCVNHKNAFPEPADLIDSALSWLPDDNLRQRVLVQNPEVLYGFHALAG
ncbi:amidohydrolase family protein [Paraburkholderia sp. MM5477-R1]|uniref:amidohydrolase family protein n=1 Tax=Paraburkholderia sp. MM5477-R1 TaxID=2991062 RepID=UPI003D22D0D2